MVGSLGEAEESQGSLGALLAVVISLGCHLNNAIGAIGESLIRAVLVGPEIVFYILGSGDFRTLGAVATNAREEEVILCRCKLRVLVYTADVLDGQALRDLLLTVGTIGPHVVDQVRAGVLVFDKRERRTVTIPRWIAPIDRSHDGPISSVLLGPNSAKRRLRCR